MKILFLTNCPAEWEGAPFSRLLYLAREAAAGGHAVKAVGSATGRPAQLDGVDVIATRGKGRSGLACAVFPFRQEVLREIADSDALVVRGYWVGFWALLAAAVGGKRARVVDFHGFVWQEQAEDGRWIRSLSTRVIERACLALSTGVIAVSTGTMSRLNSRLQRKCVVIENGVDCAEFRQDPTAEEQKALREKLGLPESGPVFAMAAHSGPWLDLKLVAAAAGLVPEAWIVIAGDDAGITAIRKDCESRGLRNVRFPGSISRRDIRALLSGVCLGCLCPYDAGWIHSSVPGFFASRKVKEYLAVGRVVIVSDVVGRGDFLVDGQTCLTYRSGNASDMAAKMKSVIANVEAAGRIGAAARGKAADFDWKVLCRRGGLMSVLRGET